MRERHRYGGSVQLVPQNRSTIGYMALVVLLVAGLAIGVALFVLQTRGSGLEPSSSWRAAQRRRLSGRVRRARVLRVRRDQRRRRRRVPMRMHRAAAGGGTADLHRQRNGAYQSDGPVAVGDTYSLYTEVKPAEGEDARWDGPRSSAADYSSTPAALRT